MFFLRRSFSFIRSFASSSLNLMQKARIALAIVMFFSFKSFKSSSVRVVEVVLSIPIYIIVLFKSLDLHCCCYIYKIHSGSSSSSKVYK